MSFILKAEQMLRARIPLGASGDKYKWPGDLAIDDDSGLADEDAEIKDAAVLVPLIDHAEGIKVLLTQRVQHLKNHGGQISFPGGRVDARDRTPIEAALRESREEIGLKPELVDVLGTLSPYQTVTGFLVTPVIGVISADFKALPAPSEVDHIFEVPLAFLLDSANHRRERIEFRGRTRNYYAIPYGDHYIWGATAAMLINFRQALLHYVDACEPGTRQGTS